MENAKNPAPTRKVLGQGNTCVWRDGNETVIHHINGLTIALQPGEATDLLEWLKTQKQEPHQFVGE